MAGLDLCAFAYVWVVFLATSNIDKALFSLLKFKITTQIMQLILVLIHANIASILTMSHRDKYFRVLFC